MIELLLASVIVTIPYEERLNRTCSYLVGIPYASDNFTDEEWERFKLCKELIQPNLI
jgi:hypothetical protein